MQWGKLAGLAVLVLHAAAAGAVQLVEGDHVTFAWEAASGPVAHYGVYVSWNGAPFPSAPDHVTTDTEVTLRATPSSVITVRVAAFDADGLRGPYSRVSDQIVFVDRGLPGAPPAPGVAELRRYDFDGDGHTDLLGRDPASGMVSVWLMGPDGPWQRGDAAAIPPHWELLASADLDRDGRSDLIWRDPQTGALRAWQMEGTALQAEVELPTLAGAEIVFAGDLDGDERSDLVWREAGRLRVWRMDLDRIGQEWELPLPPRGHRLACAGDFDGDGDLDLLWQAPVPGPPELWRLDRGAFQEAHSAGAWASAAWRAASCEDADGDAQADVLWRNPESEALVAWTLRDAAVTGTAPVPPAARGWTLAATGDFDGDGHWNELLLQDGRGARQLRVLSFAGGGTVAAADRVLAAADGARWELLSP